MVLFLHNLRIICIFAVDKILMSRKVLLTVSFALCLAMNAEKVSLRMMSQTPLEGVEESRSLLIDHYGMMWIGTDQGLRAYDGYQFRTYRSDAYTPGILPNNYIRTLTEDHQDRLWIGTRDGLTCYDRRKGTFKTYCLKSEQSRLINKLYTTSDGVVMVATNAGFARYHAETDEFIETDLPNSVASFAEDCHGNIYIGMWEDGLKRLDKKTGKIVDYPQMTARNTIASMLMDSKGRLWLGTWEHGIIRLDNPENECDPAIHHMNEGRKDFRTFHKLVEDMVSHSVWGCCIEGLTRVDVDDVTQVENYPILRFCYDMLSDGMGNLWVMTRNNGIVHLSTRPSAFQFTPFDLAGLALPVNRIQRVYTPDGQHFWLALQPYGLALYDSHSGRVLYNNQIPGFAAMTGNSGISVQTISAFYQRQDGEMWLGGTQGVIIWKNGEQARVMSRQHTPFLDRNGSVNTFLQLPDGTMLIGTDTGVGLAFTEEKGRILQLREGNSDFSQAMVRSIIQDHRKRLWIATEGEGIIRIDGDVRDNKGFTCRQYMSAHHNYPLDEATACYEDVEHRLWAISNSGGIFLYNGETDSFEPVNHLFHIGMGSVYAIEGDENGYIWLSTDKGLVRLQLTDEKKGIISHYGFEDGLGECRFSVNGSFCYDGELFFGSAGGYFSFRPEQLLRRNQGSQPELIVTELLIADKPYSQLDSALQARISDNQPFFTREITIPSDIRKFSVGFSLLAYHNQDLCKYSYCLEGYDHDWHYTEADNRWASYQNLPAGSYQLKVQALDSYGRKVELPYAITVCVLPPWYRTWWAYIIYMLLAVAAAYGVKEWYKARVRRRERLQQRVTELLHYREMMVMKQFEGARKVLEVEEQQHSSPDEQFIQKAIDCVKTHLSDGDYDREQFASDMCVSSSTLYNKLRALTGQNITAFINSIRLKEACRILRQQPDISITELSMMVGFNTPKYFTKLFKKEFGVLPRDYIEKGE